MTTNKESLVPVNRGQIMISVLSNGLVNIMQITADEGKIGARIFDEFHKRDPDISTILTNYTLGKTLSQDDKKYLHCLRRAMYKELADAARR